MEADVGSATVFLRLATIAAERRWTRQLRPNRRAKPLGFEYCRITTSATIVAIRSE
jgi:hypothetical protein